MKKKPELKKILLNIFAVLVTIALVVALVPVFVMYNTPEKLTTYISGFGIWGIFVLFVIQIFQIVVALIPGELVEFASGTLYGTIGGAVICLIGILIGQFIIFTYIRRLLKRNPDKVKIPQKLKNAKFFNEEKKLEYVIFVLFFIPGTPKDMLTYFVPVTNIGIKRFLLISCIARIPSVISSTYAGSVFREGNLIHTIAIYAIIGIISLVGLYIHNKLMNKGEKNGGN